MNDNTMMLNNHCNQTMFDFDFNNFEKQLSNKDFILKSDESQLINDILL
jgi:hypothetical protein